MDATLLDVKCCVRLYTLLRVVGSCCIRLRTTANAHATHPNIVGPTMLEVVVSVADSLRSEDGGGDKNVA